MFVFLCDVGDATAQHRICLNLSKVAASFNMLEDLFSKNDYMCCYTWLKISESGSTRPVIKLRRGILTCAIVYIA